MKLDPLFIGVLPPLSFSFIKNSVSGQLQFNKSDNIYSVCLLHSHTGPADAACLEKKKVYLYNWINLFTNIKKSTESILLSLIQAWLLTLMQKKWEEV